MKKVKNIKKIPRYNTGGLAGLNPGKIDTPAAVKAEAALASTDAAFDAMTRQSSSSAMNAVGTGIDLLGTAVSGEKPTFASAAGSTLKGAQAGMAFGPWGAVIGAAAGLLAGTAGSGAKFDETKVSTTSNIQDAVSHNTGWGGALFGRNRDRLLRKANAYQNSLVAAERTALAQADWTNDPRNQNVVFAAKEGGIVPGEHYASRNEVEVDADGNNAVRYKWDPKGKDTYHVLFNPDGSLTEGNMIFNDEGVRRPNGDKYSDTADKMIKNIKDPKLRKISLKKLAAEQEEQKEKEGKTKNGIPAHAKGGIQWGDLAYQTAAMLTPLLDREKPEKTLYLVPTAKYVPTHVDINNQIRAINDSNAITRYNMSNINPNTGAGMAYGLQAASNRAKQLSDVYTYKTNAQNESISKNVGIYNNWSNTYADIMNKVHESDAANRAAARNINRQNKAAALKAWGQINSDYNKRKMDKLRIAAARPMFKYGMENYDEMVKLLTDMGLWE